MGLKSPVCLAVLAFVLLGTAAWADQITLRDGTVYSGKFIAGDSNQVEFRILGRVETFRIKDIAQIVFKEPELDVAPAARTTPQPAQPAISGTEQNARAAATNPDRELESSPVEPEPGLEATKPDSRPYITGNGVRNPSPKTSVPESGKTLPVGTPVTIRTSTEIDTARNRVGDIFDASLDQPVYWGNETVFPRGTTVKGRIAYAKESGKFSGQSQLILELTEIIADGKSYIVRTSDYTEAGANRANRTAATVGGTAALGAIIGAIAGGGTGAAVGAASGAAVGTGVQVMTKGQVLKIPPETILEFRLQSPLTIGAQ